jgi:hypothetical protein
LSRGQWRRPEQWCRQVRSGTPISEHILMLTGTNLCYEGAEKI